MCVVHLYNQRLLGVGSLRGLDVFKLRVQGDDIGEGVARVKESGYREK